jgi:hypothetical protein
VRTTWQEVRQLEGEAVELEARMEALVAAQAELQTEVKALKAKGNDLAEQAASSKMRLEETHQVGVHLVYDGRGGSIPPAAQRSDYSLSTTHPRVSFFFYCVIKIELNTSSLAFIFGRAREIETKVSKHHFLINLRPDLES